MVVPVKPLFPLAEGLWTCSDPVRILGTRLTASMTVMALGGGDLLLYSPIAMTDERRAAVESLGRVAPLRSKPVSSPVRGAVERGVSRGARARRGRPRQEAA